MSTAEQPSPISTPGAFRRVFTRSIILRQAARHPAMLAAFIASGFIFGVAYRYFVNPVAERELGFYVRSGVHGIGIALAAWAVQTGFAATARSSFGNALRHLPIAAEIVVRSLAMTAALVIVGIGLQFILYAQPLGLHWLTVEWFATTLPRIVLIGFTLTLVVGTIAETGRLIGSRLLTSIVLGTYHRPAREQLIVMFLDIAGSTALAEQMGELRVQELFTRFFFDIDEPIGENGGGVHAYVGDEVIVTWRVTNDWARNARCLACFFAIERKMARLAQDYQREFGVAPRFRAGIHAGPVIVSECGNSKRQLAYFGDTMNVAARLCEYCKLADRRLVVSLDLLQQAAVPADLRINGGETIALRGRQERIAVHWIEPRQQNGLD
jgi:adenylate cyclase